MHIRLIIAVIGALAAAATIWWYALDSQRPTASAAEAWVLIQFSDNACDFEQFVDRYPNDRNYTELARRRLTTLPRCGEQWPIAESPPSAPAELKPDIANLELEGQGGRSETDAVEEPGSPPTPLRLTSLTSRRDRIGVQHRTMLIYEVEWEGEARRVRLDARRFGVVRFRKSDQSCALTIALINAWGNVQSDNHTPIELRQSDRRGIALSPAQEVQAIAELADRLDLGGYEFVECDVAAVRIDGANDGATDQYQLRCGANPYQTVSQDVWLTLSQISDDARLTGVAVRHGEFTASRSELRPLRQAVRQRDLCGAWAARTDKEVIEGGLSWRNRD